MGLLDELMSGEGAGAISQIAKQLGIPEDQAKKAAAAMAPALSRGIQNNAEKPGGAEALLGALSKGNHKKYVENPGDVTKPDAVEDGNKILGHILGNKDVSRNVAGAASKETGLSPEILKKMLPMLAPVVMGTLSKQAGAGGGGGGGGALGALGALAGGGGSKGAAGGLGALAGFLDTDKDGDATDDLLRLAKKFF